MEMRKVFVLMCMGLLSVAMVTGCAKSSDDSSSATNSNLTYGSLSSDGSTVNSSNSLVNGVALSALVQNIYRSGNNQNCFSNCLTNSSLTYVLSINGYAQTMAASVSTYNYGYYNNGYQYIQNSGWQAASQMACYDNACNTIVLAVFLTTTNNAGGQYKEIAIKKDMVGNTIQVVREFNGTSNQLYTATQLTTMM